ncbi:hypothetical protein QWY82_10045 [Simiduia curdlanivorans]|uniref:Uncharacterized protein n=1 Tax=Simiduia curdlanivorans TaxID=1492769 RepID=A0ABV8UYY4_9GAMM|nr:hypothetical protein [Simiduia curdlanivorans]MDN3639150.1 hypothetical protein [Simiduia curdlanivorans]
MKSITAFAKFTFALPSWSSSASLNNTLGVVRSGGKSAFSLRKVPIVISLLMAFPVTISAYADGASKETLEPSSAIQIEEQTGSRASAEEAEPKKKGLFSNVVSGLKNVGGEIKRGIDNANEKKRLKEEQYSDMEAIHTYKGKYIGMYMWKHNRSPLNPNGTKTDIAGFRDMEWGVGVPENMKYLKTDLSGLKHYTRSGDRMVIGSAKLSSIHYIFYKEALHSVQLFAVNNDVNANNLLHAADKTYGDEKAPDSVSHRPWTATYEITNNPYRVKGSSYFYDKYFGWAEFKCG